MQESRAESQVRPTGQSTAGYGVVIVITGKREGIHQRNVGEVGTQLRTGKGSGSEKMERWGQDLRGRGS